ncbi:hypothetical protein LSTR_LSTR009814 [Laodelphax striatellus]|uniref:Uncharacterized protein n=1 Tax=Laodelphax striatellus TaxID=195883 RepID=A0A482WHT3_LAOST|nr:hypothetical protein LSTR_LSTR009814 [Laodelphax striatellus]
MMGAGKPAKDQNNDQCGIAPILSLMRQLQGQNIPLKMESVWGGANPASASQLNDWTSSAMWPDGQPKMKTEQQILEDHRKAEEEKKKEEKRKQDDLKRMEEMKAAAKLAEEERKRKKKEEEEEKLRRLKEEEEAEERRRKKEEEEIRKREAAKKAELDRLRKEEEKKKKKEEDKRRKEEEKKKLEVERKRKVEEVLRQVEEDKKKKEEEARRAEQARKQTEALKRLQEQAKNTTPWATPPSTAPSTNLSEILKNERRQLKWAEHKPPAKVKSLAEIQAEEQEYMLAKQVEKERNSVSIPQTSSSSNTIWSSQSLAWNTSSSSVWGNANSGSGQGFWEDVPAPAVAAPRPAAPSKQQQQQQPPNSAASKAGAPKANAGKTKKEEMTVLKIFEQQHKAIADEFHLWCDKALAPMKGTIDMQFIKIIQYTYPIIRGNCNRNDLAYGETRIIPSSVMVKKDVKPCERLQNWFIGSKNM